MKDYEHIVIWPDYFNKNLSKAQGRRVSKSKCVFDPILRDLMDAVKGAGLEQTEVNEHARLPKRPYVRSGYVVVPKTQPKTQLLYRISKKLAEKRAKKSIQPV